MKSVILPKVSAAMNAQVTLDGAEISPFSAVTLRGLKVVITGPDPLVTASVERSKRPEDLAAQSGRQDAALHVRLEA